MYQYAKFQFECGNYSGAADYLYQYRTLCTNPDRSLSASWGKLAAEILMQNWDIALEELNRLKEIIDSKVCSSQIFILNVCVIVMPFVDIQFLCYCMQNFSSPLIQLQNRIWLMHWSLFIFFNHENGRNGIIDLFFHDRYVFYSVFFYFYYPLIVFKKNFLNIIMLMTADLASYNVFKKIAI